MNLLLLSLCAARLQETAPDSIDKSKQSAILFISGECPTCAQVRRDYESVAAKYPGKLILVNCDSHKNYCASNKILTFPTIQSYYKDQVFTYMEEEYSEQSMTRFAEVIFGSIFIEVPNKETFHLAMEHNKIQQYFIYYGPSKTDGDELFSVFKGKMRVYFVLSDQQRLIAFRFNMTVVFKGEFVREQLTPFVYQQMENPFTKLNAENLQQLLQYNILCVFVHNSSVASHKAEGKWVKKLAYYHQEQQSFIGKWYNFGHIDVAKTDLKQILQLAKIKQVEQPYILVLNNKNQYAKMINNFDEIETFLEGVADGTLPMDKLSK
ncbi:Thioredoxin-like_domain-containing protein [Hexamita inflata]|uniref:Thioredoxin-like domain-containing protein n=1 Tax=Hexamita inflata TaxID=28002 RepID=A0AA86S159_9EUKA|nr:Thioredoxin-like domain-containing protein [Hexamita inflata]